MIMILKNDALMLETLVCDLSTLGKHHKSCCENFNRLNNKFPTISYRSL
jgi:hypothetical protein